MRTQVLQQPTIGVPWLERYGDEGAAPKQTPLQSFPFSIGRNDSADLTIDSTRVSREHALISQHGKKYFIRDLGSTNGTFVNGEQIEESPLVDGDLLAIANVEFTFFSGRSEARRTTATQVIGPKSAATGPGSAWALVREVRVWHERLMHRCVQSVFQPIVSLESGETLGYEALGEADDLGLGPARPETMVLAGESRLAGRIRQLLRRVASEQAADLEGGTHLFLKLVASELEDDCLQDNLARLSRTLPSDRRLVVEVPDGDVGDIPCFRDFMARLRDRGVQIAFDGFAAGPAQVIEHREIVPDYLKLARSMVRSLRRAGDRQRQVQLVVDAGREIGCDIVATGITTHEEADLCRQLGCRFAQGSLFSPQPAGRLSAPLVEMSLDSARVFQA